MKILSSITYLICSSYKAVSENLDYTAQFIWVSFTISLWTFWSGSCVAVNGGTESTQTSLKSLFMFQRWTKGFGTTWGWV